MNTWSFPSLSFSDSLTFIIGFYTYIYMYIHTHIYYYDQRMLTKKGYIVTTSCACRTSVLTPHHPFCNSHISFFIWMSYCLTDSSLPNQFCFPQFSPVLFSSFSRVWFYFQSIISKEHVIHRHDYLMFKCNSKPGQDRMAGTERYFVDQFLPVSLSLCLFTCRENTGDTYGGRFKKIPCFY